MPVRTMRPSSTRRSRVIRMRRLESAGLAEEAGEDSLIALVILLRDRILGLFFRMENPVKDRQYQQSQRGR